LVLALSCAFAGLQVAPASAAEKRVALVIGNSAYQHTRALPNPRNDAEAIAKLLQQHGFAEVTLKIDLDYRAMRDAVRLFGDTARAADIAVVYYGGHGIEVAGENYLIPTDAKLLRDADLEYEALTLASMLSAVGSAKRLRMVILDACRNNPLGERMTITTGVTRSVTRGLARVEPKGDVLVAYSARAGTLALDGGGRHSPYAEALLKHMMTPGLDVRLMFGKVRDQVLLTTRQQQEPYIWQRISREGVSAFLAEGPRMTQKSASQTLDLDAAFDIQIGAMVILHRAALLRHDRFAHNELIQACNDYLWYGKHLEKLSGKTPPWDPNSENEATAPEVFFETAELIGLAQAIPNPSLGVNHRHFRLCHRDDADTSKFGPTPRLSGSLAVVDLVKHPDGRWQVLHAEVAEAHRRQGIATTFYDRIEAILGTRLGPSGWLSEDAYRFWEARGCRFLKYGYRQVEHLPGLWLSAKALITLREIAELKLRDFADDAMRD
jgi:hypothetical protein